MNCEVKWTLRSTAVNKVMPKTLHVRLQHYVNQELPEVQERKERGTRNQIANIHWIIEKERE